MNRFFLIIILLFIIGLFGCNTKNDRNLRVPVENKDTFGLHQNQPRDKEQKFMGYLSKEVMQHPIIDPRKEQDFFDIYENGKYADQIVVIYDKGVEPPKNRDKLIELEGRTHSFGLGGEPGTKNSYQGTIMYVRTWRYLKQQEN